MKQKFLPIIIGTDANAYGLARSFHEEYNIISLSIGVSQLIETKKSKGYFNLRLTSSMKTNAFIFDKDSAPSKQYFYLNILKLTLPYERCSTKLGCRVKS